MRSTSCATVGSALAAVALLFAAQARALVEADDLGDVTAEAVTNGFAGPVENLTDTISRLAGSKPITRPDGSPLILGNVARGEDPALSDQSQIQLFVTGDADVLMRVEYIGGGTSTGTAALGYYHYPLSAGLGSTDLVSEPLIGQGIHLAGHVEEVRIPKHSFLGLYANHDSSTSSYFTGHTRNADAHDHFLIFDTNRGWLVSLEDLGDLGDRDYEDMLVLVTFEGRADPLGVIEIPADGSTISGVGIFSGWVCRGDLIEILIDGVERSRVGSGTARDDTEPVCGRSSTGYSLLINFNRLGAGAHEAQLIVDGAVLDETTFEVVSLGEAPFLRGLDGVCDVPGFPTAGSTTTVRWSQATQGFEIVGVE